MSLFEINLGTAKSKSIDFLCHIRNDRPVPHTKGNSYHSFANLLNNVLVLASKISSLSIHIQQR